MTPTRTISRRSFLTRVVGGVAAAAAVGVPGGAIAKVDPISGTDVGLDHDPAGIVAGRGTTNARGHATVPVRLNASPDRLSGYIAERSGLRSPVIMRIDAGRQSVVSAPILPGRGRGYALDRAGRRLVVTLEGRRGEIREVGITLTAAPAPGAR